MPGPENLTPWERLTTRFTVASVYVGNFVRKYRKYIPLLSVLAALAGYTLKPDTGESGDDLATLEVDAAEVLGEGSEELPSGTDAAEMPDVTEAVWLGMEDITGEQLLSDLETVRAGDEREDLETYLLDQGFTQEQIDEGLRIPEPGEYDPANTNLVSEANLPPLGPFDSAGKQLWEIQKRIVDLDIWEQWHRERAFDDAGRDDWDGWQRHEDEGDRLWNERWDLENIANEIIRRQRKPDNPGDEPSQFKEWHRAAREFVKDCLHPRVFVPGLLIIAAATLAWLVARRQRRAT